MGTASRSDENRGNRQLVLASTGFSLLYAVCVSFFYFTPLAARPDFSAQAFDNVLNPAMFLTGVALALLVKHVPAKRQAIIPAIGSRQPWRCSSPPALRRAPPSPWPPRFSQAQA